MSRYEIRILNILFGVVVSRTQRENENITYRERTRRVPFLREIIACMGVYARLLGSCNVVGKVKAGNNGSGSAEQNKVKRKEKIAARGIRQAVFNEIQRSQTAKLSPSSLAPRHLSLSLSLFHFLSLPHSLVREQIETVVILYLVRLSFPIFSFRSFTKRTNGKGVDAFGRR